MFSPKRILSQPIGNSKVLNSYVCDWLLNIWGWLRALFSQLRSISFIHLLIPWVYKCGQFLNILGWFIQIWLIFIHFRIQQWGYMIFRKLNCQYLRALTLFFNSTNISCFIYIRKMYLWYIRTVCAAIVTFFSIGIVSLNIFTIWSSHILTSYLCTDYGRLQLCEKITVQKLKQFRDCQCLCKWWIIEARALVSVLSFILFISFELCVRKYLAFEPAFFLLLSVKRPPVPVKCSILKHCIRLYKKRDRINFISSGNQLCDRKLTRWPE